MPRRQRANQTAPVSTLPIKPLSPYIVITGLVDVAVNFFNS